ncbi:MFS transporter [Actinomadura nitritigenes]|uniref:MFS transporter n=1 Tax=Actinomadura nitritigenes TaxID=134602 RepID=UPI003D8DAFC5
MPLAVIALMAAAFGIGTAEFIILGLLPEVSTGMDVSITTAGMLVTGYALGVVFGGPVFTAAALRISRKNMLLTLLIMFIVGNVLSAVAPAYWVLMLGRILAAVCHGAFLGIASVVAADMVPQDKRSRAISLVFTGLTLANIFGTPLGTWMGQSLGWRAPFWVIGLIGVISFVGVAALVPSSPNEAQGRTLHSEISAFRSGQFWLAFAIAGLSMGSLFAAFSYITPLLTDVAGFDSGWMTGLLMIFGVGLVIGNLLGGRFADKYQIGTLLVAQALMVVVLLVFALTAQLPVIAVILLPLMGGAGFGTVPSFMSRVIDSAGEAPTLAAAMASSAANGGIAVGSFLSGLTVEAGWGYTSALIVGAGMAALAIVVTVVSARTERRALVAA